MIFDPATKVPVKMHESTGKTSWILAPAVICGGVLMTDGGGGGGCIVVTLVAGSSFVQPAIMIRNMQPTSCISKYSFVVFIFYPLLVIDN